MFIGNDLDIKISVRFDNVYNWITIDPSMTKIRLMPTAPTSLGIHAVIIDSSDRKGTGVVLKSDTITVTVTESESEVAVAPKFGNDVTLNLNIDES